jgi:hypothetical protein
MVMPLHACVDQWSAELHKRSTYQRRMLYLSVCSWPSEHLPEEDAITLLEHITNFSLAQMAQRASSLSGGMGWPKGAKRHSICGWPSRRLQQDLARDITMRAMMAVQRRRASVGQTQNEASILLVPVLYCWVLVYM